MEEKPILCLQEQLTGDGVSDISSTFNIPEGQNYKIMMIAFENVDDTASPSGIVRPFYDKIGGGFSQPAVIILPSLSILLDIVGKWDLPKITSSFPLTPTTTRGNNTIQVTIGGGIKMANLKLRNVYVLVEVNG